MAHHKQALKRHRQSLERRASNRAYTRRMKNRIKDLETAGPEVDEPTKQSLLKAAISDVARLASKGIIPMKRASRKISRMMKAHAKP